MTRRTAPPAGLVRLRRHLHRHPELSGREKETAAFVMAFLRKTRPDRIIRGLGGHGVAAVYGRAGASPTVLVRCELDALPIAETNRFAYRSVSDGVSHKCGHDGHMAVVAGLAERLHREPPAAGRAVLLFQPSEEIGMGASAVLRDPKFRTIRPDYVFALHNLPGYARHTVVCRPGAFTPAVHSLVVRLDGKTAHAGEPHRGRNPARAVAAILEAAAGLERPSAGKDYSLVTPIQVVLGEEAYGISAGHAVMRFTLRCRETAALEKLGAAMEKSTRAVARKHKLDCTVSWTQFFASNRNDPAMAKLVREAARANGLAYQHRPVPFQWGEDFGLFTEKFPGALFCIGAGERAPALHNPDYDFPDAIIPTGVAMFHTLLNRLLR